MAERGRSNFRFCSRFLRDNKRDCNNNKQKKKKKRFLNQKLEQEKHNSSGNKGLSLDPHRNLHHHHLFQNRNHGDAEEEEEEEEKQDKYNFSLTNHQELPAASFQELFHQNQLLLYGRRLDPADHHQPPPEPTPPLKKRSHFPSRSSSLGLTTEHASLRGKMPESYQNPSPRLGGLINNAAVVGEIVEVQGGHIVRSIGRKDRHSKVCTAKGPRDRRVRLAAHTAIQFYDVQDRLGYDRPSKAVDWLIKKAKAAIDELAELPAWHPTAAPSAPDAAFEQENAEKNLEAENQQHNIHHQADLIISNVSGSSNKSAMAMFGGENEQISSFLPPSLDSDVIADTIKSFFPTGCAAGETSSSSMQFRNFSTNDLLSRNSNNNTSQDLRLSLQSLQDPDFVHHHHNPPPNTNPRHRSEQQARAQGQNVVLNDSPLGFNGWLPLEHHQPAYEHNRLQRLAPWNPGGDTTTASTPENAGFLFNSPPPAAQQIFGGHHNQFSTSSQRGPLQSSNTPSVRAWMEPSAAITLSMADQHHHPGALPVYPSLFSGGIGFASGYGGFSGFHIPARIQGDEEEHDGYSDKPSSASSDSRH